MILLDLPGPKPTRGICTMHISDEYNLLVLLKTQNEKLSSNHDQSSHASAVTQPVGTLEIAGSWSTKSGLILIFLDFTTTTSIIHQSALKTGIKFIQ